MKTPAMRILFILAAEAAAVFSLTMGDNGYLQLVALALFLLAAFMWLGTDDNTILVLATGELLVISTSAASFWTAVIVQCAVIGAVWMDGRVPPGMRDAALFILCCSAVITAGFIFDRSNQVLLPFLGLIITVGATMVVLVGVQEMRERRLYAGGK